jgi:hypothetical protein
MALVSLNEVLPAMEAKQQTEVVAPVETEQQPIELRSTQSNFARRGILRGLGADIVYVISRDKKWWLLPLLIVLLLLAVILAISAVAGPLAPFLYPLL